MNPTVPAVNLNQTPTGSGGSPYGGFQLSQCDGPDYSNLKTHISVEFQGQTYSVPPNPPGYRPCDFNGFMVQVQFLINVMLVVGVVAALGMFAYSGFLYMSGSVDKRKKAHAIFPKVFWGFIIMLTAWFIVYQILQWLAPGSQYLTGATH